ncbi:hypothetical protein HHI36_020735 [Cryptolaemus montrouzieri]|uniref:Uncharacterized protein n=1 Tax=Cryptolaemus montrouzieri TaxID=559131 RepID=A0ABD2NC92_9CUCU
MLTWKEWISLICLRHCIKWSSEAISGTNVNDKRKHEITLKTFGFEIAGGLLLKGKKRGRPLPKYPIKVPKQRIRNPLKPLVNQEVRKDSIGHYPIFTKKCSCRNCYKGQTSVMSVFISLSPPPNESIRIAASDMALKIVKDP